MSGHKINAQKGGSALYQKGILLPNLIVGGVWSADAARETKMLLHRRAGTGN